MFKLAVISDEISQDLDVVIRFAQENLLQGVELRSVWEKGPFDWTDEDVARMNEKLTAAGLPVCAIGAPFFKCDQADRAAVAQHIAAFRRLCGHAHTLGAGIIRGFSFWKTEAAPDMDAIAAEFAAVTPILEEENILLVLEPDPAVNTPNGASLARLLQKIDHPRVGALWDPGNIPFDTAGEAAYPEGYEAVRPWMKHMHLKDALRENDVPRAVPFGTGQVDMEGQFRRLVEEDFYSGWVSLEPHYRLDRVLDEATLRLPAGSAFSAGGYAAGQDTMERFREKMAQWFD